MKEEIEKIKKVALEEIEKATNAKELEDARVK